ncbi:MAG TPA: menaquinone biosynthesis protein [Verrucomicrobiae bacterium]|jgi:chorismate dehydratase|nr:menaquinone biosynthesis protein [Verrucomicrobiae bacterium]
MPTPEDTPKLRLAPLETPEELARRFERETRPVLLQRESQLETSLGNFKAGSVPYLNAAPLTRGLEEQILFAPPSELARLLRNDELDAALLSVTEVLLNDRYDVLDGVAVASLGEVKSVFLAHRQPLENAREIFCDTASLASVNLLKVLLAERGIEAALKPLPNYEGAAALDNVLLIGDPAIHFLRSKPAHEIWDLGEAWFELTKLPFVYAVWALRRIPNELLRRRLREAKNFGMDTLDYIISSRTEFDLAFRKDYLSWHIHYHLGAEERRGIARFIELLRKHQLGPVYEPRFVA